jgi:hypothetical protein
MGYNSSNNTDSELADQYTSTNIDKNISFCNEAYGVAINYTVIYTTVSIEEFNETLISQLYLQESMNLIDNIESGNFTRYLNVYSMEYTDYNRSSSYLYGVCSRTIHYLSLYYVDAIVHTSYPSSLPTYKPSPLPTYEPSVAIKQKKPSHFEIGAIIGIIIVACMILFVLGGVYYDYCVEPSVFLDSSIQRSSHRRELEAELMLHNF